MFILKVFESIKKQSHMKIRRDGKETQGQASEQSCRNKLYQNLKLNIVLNRTRF